MMLCPNCGSSRLMKNGYNANVRKYKCGNCGHQPSETSVRFAAQTAPATPAPPSNVCIKCGKPITGGYRKLGEGKKVHLVCPKEDKLKVGFRLFESALTGMLIR